jgi:uncharacterized membrane protein HdeD (DUF308 family)
MVEAMSRNWGTLAIRGLLAIVFGIVAFMYPGPTVAALVILVAAFAIVEGVVNLIGGIRGREGWAIAEGVISVIAGVVFVIWPGLTALALLYLVAAWAIITGVLRIVAAIQLRRALRNEWLLVLSGIASLIFGVVAAIFPGAGIVAIIWFVAAWAIILGVLLVALALSLRSLAHGPSTAGAG